MQGLLACIGFPSWAPETAQRTIEPLLEAAQVTHKSGGAVHSLWRDPSGAAIAFHLRGGELECMTPCFVPAGGKPLAWKVQSRAPLIDPTCVDCSGATCDVLDAEGDTATRAAVQFATFPPYAKWLKGRRRYALHVTAFATELDVFATRPGFDEVASRIPIPGPEGTPMRFATNFFMPAGIFADPGTGEMSARARVLFAGTVTQALLRTNSATTRKFWHLQIDTLPGMIDVVHPEREGLFPAHGQLALVGAWLVGRPAAPPPRATRKPAPRKKKRRR